jgi:Tfp pilus assembly protein FimT
MRGEAEDCARRMRKIHFGRDAGSDKIPRAVTRGRKPMAAAAKLDGRRGQVGASLIEALMALAVAGVLASAAVPSMQDALARQRLHSASSDLYAAFHLARSEAIKRAAAVAVTPVDGGNWSTGWRIFADRDDDGLQDADEETILDRPAADAAMTIRAYFGATFAGTALSYDAEGRLHRPGGRGLVIGRLVLTLNGATRSLCFASLSLRAVAAATCD